MGRTARRPGIVGPEDGRLALFFHGSPGCGLQALRLESAAHTRGVRLVAVDRPGCGRTSPPSNALLEQHVEDVKAILEALHLDSAAAVSVSGGVAAVLTAAAALPERLDRIIIGSGLGLLTSRDQLAGASMANAAVLTIARQGALAARLAVAVPYLVSRLAPERTASDGDDERLRAVIREARETFWQGTRGPAEDLSSACRLERVDTAAVGQPVIAWHGARDRHAPLPAMRALVEQLPNATLHVVEAADHFVFESHAVRMLASLDGPG